MADVVAGDDRDDDRPAPAPAEPTARIAERRGFFDIYKPGQGFHTRTGTAIGAGVLVCWGAYFLYEKMALVNSRPVQVFSAVAVILAFGLFGYWALALNRKVCDFLIATEGEMKKVNWTSRKEIIGSTKVVIFVTLALSVLLFVVDSAFIVLFNWLGVLKGGGLFQAIRNLF